MAWTTRIVRIDAETNEVLSIEDVDKRNYEKIGYEKIYNKLTETHNEIVIVQKYRPRAQQRIQFK